MSEQKITVTIDGISVEVSPSDTILTAAQLAGVEIPTLCQFKGLNPEGSCRMCLVEVEGNRKGLATACTQPCTDGMVVHTKTEACVEAHRFVLDLLLSNHQGSCFNCSKNGACKLQDYCLEYGVERTNFETPVQPDRPETDRSNPYLVYEPDKCILCRRCQRTCAQIHGKSTLAVGDRGFSTSITPVFGRLWEETDCDSCGACAAVCPVGALTTKDHQKYRAFACEKQEATCPGCDKACQFALVYRDGELVGCEPVNTPENLAKICVKGSFQYRETFGL
jgi:formate dehydrogenase major subunit